MNIYITTGSFEFLKKLEHKHPEEKLITVINENGALLYHETNGATVFKEPRRYLALEAVGEIEKEGFVVLNYIPVTEEGRPLFEHQIKNRVGTVEVAQGFKALRVLQPLSSNTYVIMTVWKNEISYGTWQSSDSFLSAHQNKGLAGDQGPKIFSSAPYVSRYTITE
jgi:heme oxygenase (mycobilin-producing)